MVRPLRTLLSLAILAGMIWCSFKVPLGKRTFAEHVDQIGQTPEARQLVDDARGTVNPVLEEATNRLLGEHVEAPTRIDGDADVTLADHAVPAAAREAASDDEAPKLPGR